MCATYQPSHLFARGSTRYPAHLITTGGKPAIFTFPRLTKRTAKDYQVGESDGKLCMDWKKFMKLGLQIKLNWRSLAQNKKNILPNFEEDSQMLSEEFYGVLREFSSLPKLRKENLFVENDLNTIHQRHMYDFIYDQQDVYDYYNEIFEEKNKSFNYTPINVRQGMLPFAFLLENFDDVLAEFSEERDMQCLANLRWYIFQNSFEGYESVKLNNNNKLFNNFDEHVNYNPSNNDDLFTIFSTTCSDIFSSKLIEEYQVKNTNHILSLLNSIILTLTFFCKMSFAYIMKYHNSENNQNDHLFLDCYIKRYKSYIEAAVYLNEQLENLNVLVNYLYETLFKDYPKNPKFSIYRLMVIIWNREVTLPLTDIKMEKNLISLSLRIFKKFLTVEVNKVYGCDIRINRAKSDPQWNSRGVVGSCNVNVKMETHSEDEADLEGDDGSLSNQNNSLTCGLSNNYQIILQDSKTSILEDVYTFDFQAKYFLEQIPCLLLDPICNEYSTFYINDSQFPISHSYQVFENNMIKIIEKFIKSYFTKVNKLNLIHYLKTQDFINTKLINRTKKRVVESISGIILNLCESEIMLIFQEYLVNNIFSDKDAEMFLKAFDSHEEKANPLYEKFFKMAGDFLHNQLGLAEYATLYFMKEIIRGKNHLYVTIEETKQWLNEVLDDQTIIDKQVRKENNRRNIHLDGDVYQDQLFNFNPNLTFNHILEIYGIDAYPCNAPCTNLNVGINMKNSSKLGEDIIMTQNFEDMSTFPQTFDAHNFNMEMEIDTGLDLRRK